jgi:predicted RNA binding protein YcfA (HicA-like mRNA interferase family)
MPSPVRFAIVRRMLESKGYRMDRVTGSHHVFVKPGAPSEAIPVHGGKVKPYYVRKIEKFA